MLSTLITSKARRTILTLFLTHPEERFYQKQLIRQLGMSSSLVQKELRKLEEIGFVTSSREANTRFFAVNKDFPLYQELKSIVYKTVGLADFLREALHDIGSIRAAFIYGSVAKNLEDARSDIDLMVIGDVDQDKLHEAVSAAENALGREVNYSIFEPADWKSQLAGRKAFVTSVAEGPKVFLVGGEDELR
ncbi:MAG: nucleotidyltransferase domain-containing protein [Thermoleophilia bacterium]|nr:nucleotidyltransferase domain-containing protein [Thermoleophilia bacterium]